MHGAVPLDKQGELLDENIQLYCDKRTYELVGRLYQDGTAEDYMKQPRDSRYQLVRTQNPLDQGKSAKALRCDP